jgi:hypothetical protein
LAQVKVARAAMSQALAWNEDDDTGMSKSKALKIIVLEGLFSPRDFDDEAFSDRLEREVASECQRYGDIEKITVFSKNARGVVVVKYATSYAAQECVRALDGRAWCGGARRPRCYFWDGLTDYSAGNDPRAADDAEELEKARLDEFGDYLEQEQEELPEEFRLQVET